MSVDCTGPFPPGAIVGFDKTPRLSTDQICTMGLSQEQKEGKTTLGEFMDSMCTLRKQAKLEILDSKR